MAETMTEAPCRVYWGSHGCDRPRGHAGYHRCACADDDPTTRNELGQSVDEDGVVYVGAYPYYGDGEATRFSGEDA